MPASNNYLPEGHVAIRLSVPAEAMRPIRVAAAEAEAPISALVRELVLMVVRDGLRVGAETVISRLRSMRLKGELLLPGRAKGTPGKKTPRQPASRRKRPRA